VSVRRQLIALTPGSSEYLVMPRLAVSHATRYELTATAAMPDGVPAQRTFALFVSA